MCLYKIKTALMKAILKKKKASQPFDYEKAESFKLSENDDWTMNNSYYFSAHDYAKKQSLYCRLGLRNTHSEVWFVFVDGDSSYVHTENFYTENSPLKVFKEDEKWKVRYDGELTSEKGEKIKANFSGEFLSNALPLDFFSHMATIRTAKAMAYEKWTGGYFDEVQKNNSVHYEQLGELKGELTLDGNKIEIDLPCVRDHSYGRRDYNYMNNHVWLMAVESESYLNFSMVSYPAMTLLEVGNFKEKDKPMALMIKADYDRKEIIKGFLPDQIKMTFTLDDGRKVNFIANKIFETPYSFQNGEYNFVEGIGEFEIDGKNYRGIMEIGFNKDDKRFFNGKKVGQLKN